MSTYEYQSLTEGEIRTCLLYPSSAPDPDAPIKIELRHQSLDEQPQYEALSFTWGDATELHEVHCEGRILKVTANLKAALLRLRGSSSPREFWVDALCINQSDEVEKQGQVAVMRRIFGGATKTTVWLGEEADDVAVAVDFFNRQEQRTIAAFVEHINNQGVLPEPEEVSLIIGNINRAFGTSPDVLFMGFDQQRTRRAIANFLARPWFRRAWTVQEFIVSETIEIRCGDLVCTQLFPILNFEWAFKEAEVTWHNTIDSSRRRDMFRGMAQMVQLQSHRNEYWNDDHEGFGSDFLTVLRRYRGSQTTRPEDKLWAFQSLAYTDDISSQLSLWAGKPKRALYVALATHYMDGAGSSRLDLLSEASRSPRLGSDLPSWVPDWNEMPTMTNLSRMHSGQTKRRFNAGGPDLDPGICFRVEGELLLTAGCILCNVITVGDHWPDWQPGASNVSSCVSAFTSLQKFIRCWPSATYFNGQNLLYVMVSTMQLYRNANPTFDWSITDWEERTPLDPLTDLEFDAVTISDRSDANSIGSLAQIVQKSPEQGRNLAQGAAGRRAAVCVGEHNAHFYMGMFPLATEEGDTVCILRSCAVPLVLRPVDDGRFRLIGDCYVHGVMDGELLDEMVWQDIEIE